MEKSAFILVYFIPPPPPQLTNKNTNIALLSTVLKVHVEWVYVYIHLSIPYK